MSVWFMGREKRVFTHQPTTNQCGFSLRQLFQKGAKTWRLLVNTRTSDSILHVRSLFLLASRSEVPEEITLILLWCFCLCFVWEKIYIYALGSWSNISENIQSLKRGKLSFSDISLRKCHYMFRYFVFWIIWLFLATDQSHLTQYGA